MKPVPLHFQTQSTECGLASMGMILAHFGRHVELDTLRRISGVSRDCVDAKDLLRIADHYGLSARVVRTEPERLSRLGFPLVVFTDFIHFTVVEALDDRTVQIADPGFGRYTMPREEFDESFTGVALSFSPGERFVPGGRAIPLWRRILRQYRHCPPGLLTTAFAAHSFWAVPLLPALLYLPLSGGGAEATWISWGGAGLAGTGAALVASAWASSRAEDHYCRNRLTGMARHILTQSHAFFVYRVHAVMAQRVGSHDAVAEMLFRKVLPAVGALLAIPLILLALGFVHLPTALAVAGLAAVHAVLNLAADRAAALRGRSRQDDRDIHWMKLSHSLENFESFKTSGGDREFFNHAMGLCARRLDVRQRVGLFKLGAEASADLAFWLMLPVLVLTLQVWPLTPGRETESLISIFCLLAMLHLLLRAVSTLHGTLDTLRISLPALDDLSDSATEPTPPKEGTRKIAGGAALRVRDARFGFSSVKPPLFERITVSIEPGEWIALTGPSGGGKSALAALMIGLHQPWSGDVVLDGVPVRDIPPAERARRIGWLDKHPFFAPGTIRDNIRLWDETLTEADLRNAVADVCLDDVIAGLPDGLDTPLTPGAGNISGGQRQRIELARVLARNPGLIVIDEATDGLDPDTEQRLFRNLRRRGTTVLMISHRASTIAACDRALRLSDGRLEEAGAEERQARPLKHGANPFQAADVDAVDPGAMPLRDPAALVLAFESVARASGVRSIVVVARPGGATLRAALLNMARQHRLMLRPIRFVVADWWRRDCGPLIAFAKQDGRPVGIDRDASGRWHILNADGSAGPPMDPVDSLMPTAYRLYPCFAPAAVRVRDFFLAPLKPIAACLTEGLLADLLLAFLLVGAPIGVYALLSVGVPPLIWIGGLALWGTGVLVLCATRLAAGHRIEGVLELSAHSALYQHLMRIQPLFIRGHAPQQVNRSLQAVPELLALLRGGAMRRLALGFGAVTCLAFIAWAAPDLTGLALLLMLPFALVPAGLAALRSRPATALLSRRPAGRVFLAALTKNAAKLRQAARTEPALAEWARLVDAERGPAGLVRRWEAAADAALNWYVLAAAGLFVVAVLRDVPESPLHAATVLAFLLAAIAARQASGALCEIAHAGPALRRLRLLARAPVDPAPEGSEGDGEGANDGSLELVRVRYRYPTALRPAVEDVSLRVGPGEIVALTGPSGCGKSTLLRLVLGFHAPEGGEILRGGAGPGELDISAWREEIGAVLQDDELEQAMTIRGHIGGEDGFTLAEIREAARMAQLEADLDAMPMGIQTIVDSERISTGQKQRILIARRLVRKPKLLILDEATNALSDAMQAEIFGAIRALGITCLVVSHRASALALADRVYRMAEGRLVAEKPASPVLESDVVSERSPEWTP